ncbi:MAG TPA: methionyl-tRNA formyltransferase [Terriglobales bacterium]|jgi:methionyl-tRNA formyltransferase
MDLVFCGTPRFAVPTLRRLVAAGLRVHLVVTQPDRPSGRGLEVTSSPVKECAGDLHLPIVQPEKIKNNEPFRDQLAALKPEAIIVVGYGRIIPQWMIDLPRLGNINLHASLLPRHRGAAPIQWAIAAGDTVTGVSSMRIDAGLDTGDILLQREEPVVPDDTAESLAPRLAEAGADLMVETLRELRNGTIHPRPQDNSQATLAPILKKEDGLINWQREALQIWNRLRGFQPWPGAYTSFRGKQLRIHAAKPSSISSPISPGQLLASKSGLIVGCGAGTALELIEVQIEGKSRMGARDFIHGYRPAENDRLGL